jgi:hypothetical protein
MDIKDKESLTEEEAKTIFMTVLEEMSGLLTKYLGKDEYACYINVVWDKPTTGKENTYHSIHGLTHPENDDKTKDCMEHLSSSLYEDPFVAGSVLHHTVSNFLENNYNTILGETDTHFRITGVDTKGVN